MSSIPQFMDCQDSHKYTISVEENDIFAKGLGLQSTPTFIILKEDSTKIAAIDGNQPIEVFDCAIGQLLNNT